MAGRSRDTFWMTVEFSALSFPFAYEPALDGDESNAGLHRRLSASECTTRLLVSSCSGTLGIQNLVSELASCNNRSPSGSLVRTGCTGLDERRRIEITNVPNKLNDRMSRSPACCHLEFDSPWVFPDSFGGKALSRTKNQMGKVPDFAWIGRSNASLYGYRPYPTQGPSDDPN